MNEQHWAKLLQIAGILIGTGFGSIILSPDVMEGWANGITKKFLSEGDSWSHTLSSIKEFLPRVSKVPGIKFQHFSALLNFFAWISLLVSLIYDIDWLFYISITILIWGLLARAALHIVIDLFLRKQPFWKTVKGLLMAWLFGLIISPIFHSLITISYYILRFLVFVFHSVARKNIVRRGLIVIGFVLVLIGLIWDFYLIGYQ